jgi:hypothetical protein
LEKELYGHFLPSILIDHFTIKEVLLLGNIKRKSMFLEILLEENNCILGSFNSEEYESKGFTESYIQDFPIRGKAVFLKIRRRRWRNKSNHSLIIRNDYSYIADGSGFTKELSDFLKYSHQYKN